MERQSFEINSRKESQKQKEKRTEKVLKEKEKERFEKKQLEELQLKKSQRKDRTVLLIALFLLFILSVWYLISLQNEDRRTFVEYCIYIILICGMVAAKSGKLK